MKQIRIWACILLTAASTFGYSQNEKLDLLNEQILFINDGIHGLIMAHILFENYNQDINKYVDLDADTINAVFTNDSFAKNVFDDILNYPIYDITAVQRYKGLISNSKLTGPSKKYVESSMNHLTQINTLRFTIDDYIKANDLRDKEKLYQVYVYLEECVSLFDAYYFNIQLHYEELRKAYNNLGLDLGDHKSLYTKFTRVQASNKAILDALRAKADLGFDQLIKSLQDNYIALKKELTEGASSKPIYGKMAKNPLLLTRVEKSIQLSKQFYETAEVPANRKQYGKFYYYYNNKLLTNFNTYGPGYIQEMNKAMDKLDVPGLYLMEVPHYFKVIYPKVLDTVDQIVATDTRIERIPTKLKNREIVESQYKIISDTSVFELKLFDNKIQDGDIVSINFNGDWILENHSIESKPTTLNLSLNKQGKNYLLLHSVNEGRRPPNTLAVKYREGANNPYKEISLKSDKNTSQMIEIIYQPN